MALSPKLNEIALSVARDREALLAEVEGLSPTQLDHKPTSDAWSVSEVLHHLALAAEATVRLANVMRDRMAERPPPADLLPEESVLGSIDALVAGADEGKAVAPDRVTPRSYVPAEESLARLRAAQMKLLEILEALSPYDLRELTYRHPFFGELNLYQWFLIGGWHERRHTRQIERIKSSPGFPG